jgi:ribosomal protein L32
MYKCANCGADKIEGPVCPLCGAIYARAEAVYKKRKAKEAALTDSKLIACPQCGKNVPGNASSCPDCGVHTKKTFSKYFKISVKYLFAIFFFLSAITISYYSINYFNKKHHNENAKEEYSKSNNSNLVNKYNGKQDISNDSIGTESYVKHSYPAKKEVSTEKILNRIELIGLIPGISTKYQVESISKNSYSNRFEIGGYILSCYPQYIDNILSVLLCLTGEEDLSYDVTKGTHREASNVEVHESLLNGLTKKFGQPIVLTNENVHNYFGATFNKSTAMWGDKYKNYLMLQSIHEKVGQGMLLMVSEKGYNDFVKINDNANNSRNF